MPERHYSRAELDGLCADFVAELKSGEIPIPDKLIRNLSRAPLVEERTISPRMGASNNPSRGELVALWHVSNGKPHKQVAFEMGVGVETVKSLLRSAYAKLGVTGDHRPGTRLVSSRAVAMAIRAGIIP